MTTHNTQWQTYRKFKQSDDRTKLSFLQRFIVQLQQLSREIVKRFMTSEPIVQQIKERNGQIWWHVYDPMTRRSAYLASEEEVLIWLEERFAYRQADSNLNDVDLYRSQGFR